MSKEITGRKFFFIFAGFFGVIITVNLALAFNAVKTFPGVETKSPYVRNQSFDADRAAQLALGWDVSARVAADGLLHLSITETEGGAPVEVASLSGTFGRATTVRDDQAPHFTFTGQDYTAPVEVTPGNWNLRMTAIAKDGTKFQQRVIVRVE